jgi:hypothetical protein
LYFTISYFTSCTNYILKSIVRAECRRLCGAIEYSTVISRRNSHPIRINKYVLPDPDAMPRLDAQGILLHNPQWGKPTTNSTNRLFIDAVVDAVPLVPVSYADTLTYISITDSELILPDPRLSPQLGVIGAQYATSPKLTSGSYLPHMQTNLPNGHGLY